MKRRKPDLSESLKQQFKKDIELFEYFLVLLNDSSPIRNVELMWAEDLELFDPVQPLRVNTSAALVELKPVAAGEGSALPSPSTHFCDLVHGFGKYEEQTCARSDKPAKERCRATGCSQVYPCHVGLTDLAVPVVSDGRYLGTLFSGQVLTEAPTAEGFAFVKQSLSGQEHIDLAALEEAYYRVPVVSREQLANMVRMLEVFARYLGNSWKRLEIMSEFERVRERELQLDRREMAELLLAAKGQFGGRSAVDVETLKMLAASTGMEKLPDRVLVMRLQAARTAEGESLKGSEGQSQIGDHLTISRVAHLIEDRARSWANSFAAMVGPAEICIFTAQKSRSAGQERLLLDEMAQALLRTARSEGLTSSKIGVSAAHPDASELLGAYHEAAAAMDAGQGAVSWYETMPERRQQPVQLLGKILKAIESTDSSALSATMREFLQSAAPVTNNTMQLQHSRGMLTWASEHLALELATLGAASETVNEAKERAVQMIVGAQNSYAMTEAFRNYVEQLRQFVQLLFSQREEKIVLETQRMVREQGPEKVTIHSLAKNLKISAGHLGRVYSRTTGQTLEEYLIRQRLEMGKRLLLDPRLQVAEVAYLCGFCNPAYFSSVFKKHMNCTPRAYARQPQRWGGMEAEPAAMKR